MNDPRVAMILQARMGSTRLPGKSLMPLAGKPLLLRILERVARCRTLDAIVLATTELPADDAIAALGSEFGVGVFRGSENDLVDRYLNAARTVDADAIVRLPADNPVTEPGEIDRIVEFYLNGATDFASNLSPMLDNGYPDGIGAEVFSTTSLEYIWRTVSDPNRREHPHLNFFDYKTQLPADALRFHVGTVQCPDSFRRPDLRLDVNTAEDYAFIAELYSALHPSNPNFHITDIIDWYDRRQRAICN
jgi:spore coat polysaccharide biosynthesis protein SpsF